MTFQTSVVESPAFTGPVEATKAQDNARPFRWVSAEETQDATLRQADAGHNQASPPKRGVFHLLRALFASLSSAETMTGVAGLWIEQR